MNTVMTAGLHHRWRTRAVDLARVGPGTRALDVATGTGDLAIELASRGGDVVGSDFSEGMLDRARAKAPGLTLGAGRRDGAALRRRRVRRGDRGLRRAQLRRPRRAGLREMVRVVKPGGRVGDPRDHDAAEAAACPRSSRCGSIASCRCSGRFDEAYTYLPSSVKRFPGPEPLAGELVAAGCSRRRLDPHRGRDHRPPPRDGRADGERRGGRRGRRGGGRARPRADARPRGAAGRDRAARTGATLGEHAGATIAAGGKRLRPLLVFVAAGPDPAGHDAALRAAVAVELVHSATLVHDDVLDAAVLRRGRPTVVAVRGPVDRDGDRRPAVLARVRRARGRRDGRAGAGAVGRLVRAGAGRAAAARGRVEPADDARALPAPLRSQDRAAVPRGVRAGRAGGRRERRAAGRVRRADRARVPAARRRAGRVAARPSGPASTAAPTCWTARSRCR